MVDLTGIFRKTKMYDEYEGPEAWDLSSDDDFDDFSDEEDEDEDEDGEEDDDDDDDDDENEEQEEQEEEETITVNLGNRTTINFRFVIDSARDAAIFERMNALDDIASFVKLFEEFHASRLAHQRETSFIRTTPFRFHPSTSQYCFSEFTEGPTIQDYLRAEQSLNTPPLIRMPLNRFKPEYIRAWHAEYSMPIPLCKVLATGGCNPFQSLEATSDDRKSLKFFKLSGYNLSEMDRMVLNVFHQYSGKRVNTKLLSEYFPERSDNTHCLGSFERTVLEYTSIKRSIVRMNTVKLINIGMIIEGKYYYVLLERKHQTAVGVQSDSFGSATGTSSSSTSSGKKTIRRRRRSPEEDCAPYLRHPGLQFFRNQAYLNMQKYYERYS